MSDVRYGKYTGRVEEDALVGLTCTQRADGAIALSLTTRLIYTLEGGRAVLATYGGCDDRATVGESIESSLQLVGRRLVCAEIHRRGGHVARFSVSAWKVDPQNWRDTPDIVEEWPIAPACAKLMPSDATRSPSFLASFVVGSGRAGRAFNKCVQRERMARKVAANREARVLREQAGARHRQARSDAQAQQRKARRMTQQDGEQRAPVGPLPMPVDDHDVGAPASWISMVFARKNGAVRRCYEAARGRDPAVAPRVTAHVQVDTTGTVRSVDILHAEGDFAECVRRKFMGLRGLPPPPRPAWFMRRFVFRDR